MGLSASQARVLLLTSKNDALELQAQLISNERLVLAQEQERIANEYSDYTGNEIWTCEVQDNKDDKKGTTSKNLSLSTLAQANQGKQIYVKIGTYPDGTAKYIGAKATYGRDEADGEWKWNIEYNLGKLGEEDTTPLSEKDGLVDDLNAFSYNSVLQVMARNNNLEIYIEDTNADDSIIDDGELATSSQRISGKQFTRKAPESLSTVSSRYYTEDDAQAQAEYNVAMARVNAIDKKLENKLNQIETQKKAVETELESSKNIVKTNEERTFKYFS